MAFEYSLVFLILAVAVSEPEVDVCVTQPCSNAGSCQVADNQRGYLCDCTGIYTGLHCETVFTDPCVPNPCENDGRCTPSGDSGELEPFLCVCAPGTNGTKCEIGEPDDICDVSRCQNGGSCYPSNWYEYKCACRLGYEGERCDESNDALAGTPPLIENDEPQTIFVPYGQSAILKCGSSQSGDPKPSIEWRHNWIPIAIVDHFSLGVHGSLRVRSFQRKDSGRYQCYASNEFGTAMSNTNYLLPAVVYDQSEDAYVPRPLGMSTNSAPNLNCQYPYSQPRLHATWVKYDPRTETMARVVDSSRVNINEYPSDGLIFANLEQEDNGCYKCNLFHRQLNRTVTGGIYCLDVSSGDEPHAMNALVAYSSQSSSIVTVLGEPLKITCMFKGRPTPTITWSTQMSGDDSWQPVAASNGDGISVGDHGKSLSLLSVLSATPDRFRCLGRSGNTTAHRIFTLRKGSRPTWVSKPQSVTSFIGGEATILCDADGTPRPDIDWRIDGVPIERAGRHPSVHVRDGGKRLTITVTDTAVLQCNASNEHGYAFANAYVRVVPQNLP